MGEVLGPQPLVTDGLAGGEVVLGELRGRRHQGERARVERADRAGEVDGADRLAGVRVVDRGRGAGELVVLRDEVLRGVDLHRRVRGQGGAHRVGARGVLAPAEALGELEVVGDVQHPGGALAPEDVALRVGDDHDVHRLVGDLEQRGAQDGEHLGQRVRLADRIELAVVEDPGGRAVVRVDVRGERAAPGVGHHVALRDLATAAGEHRIAHARQQRRALHRIAPDERVGPRTVQTPRHPPPRESSRSPIVLRACY